MKIDIVITSYNRREKVFNAIESALNLTERTGGKVIIVDDASSDGTILALTKKYTGALNAAQLVLSEHKINQGVTAAKNTGYMISDAEWVVFLDSDDTIIQDKINAAIHILSKNRQAPLIFFRCSDPEGKVVGTTFSADKWLSLNEYVQHTSYGEVLTAINRKMILTKPYIDALRGYEGLGCARIIRNYGKALLSKLILRKYDQSGDDRLSSGWGFTKRLGKLAKGHVLFLKEFYHNMAWSTRMKYIIKIIVYSFISLFINILSKK